MSGQELFKQYTSKRDYSGSPEDEYAQLLDTIQGHIREDVFPILEDAEDSNKKLSISYPEGVVISEIDSSMIELV